MRILQFDYRDWRNKTHLLLTEDALPDAHKREPEPPHGHRDRGVSTDEPTKKGPPKGEPKGSHDPEAAGYEADKTFEPDRDGSRS